MIQPRCHINVCHYSMTLPQILDNQSLGGEGCLCKNLAGSSRSLRRSAVSVVLRSTLAPNSVSSKTRTSKTPTSFHYHLHLLPPLSSTTFLKLDLLPAARIDTFILYKARIRKSYCTCTPLRPQFTSQRHSVLNATLPSVPTTTSNYLRPPHIPTQKIVGHGFPGSPHHGDSDSTMLDGRNTRGPPHVRP